jgi:hypothetical protein
VLLLIVVDFSITFSNILKYYCKRKYGDRSTGGFRGPQETRGSTRGFRRFVGGWRDFLEWVLSNQVRNKIPTEYYNKTSRKDVLHTSMRRYIRVRDGQSNHARQFMHNGAKNAQAV